MGLEFPRVEDGVLFRTRRVAAMDQARDEKVKDVTKRRRA